MGQIAHSWKMSSWLVGPNQVIDQDKGVSVIYPIPLGDVDQVSGDAPDELIFNHNCQELVFWQHAISFSAMLA